MPARRRGQIIPRGPGTWLLRITLPADAEGKRGTWNRTVHGAKKDAERALTAALRDLDEGRLEDPSRMPLAAWLQEWLQGKRQELRGRTVESYGLWIRLYLEPTLGKVRLADLKPIDVQRAIADLASGAVTGKPVGPVTIRNAFGRLRQALSEAVRLRLIPSNPAQDARLPRNPRRGPKRVLTPEETTRLNEAVAGHRLAALWTLSLGLALRPGEALALKWEDVDRDKRRLRICRSLWHPKAPGAAPVLTPPKNASSVRDLPLSSALLAVLKFHRARQAAERLAAGQLWKEQGLIFADETGGLLRPRNVSKAFSRLLARAGLGRLSPHGLRHTGATHLVKAGIDPAHVAALLGHSSVKTTLETYVKVGEDRLEEGADLLSALLFSRQQQRADEG